MFGQLDFPRFVPHPWLKGPHAQTLATQLPRRKLAEAERHYSERRFRVTEQDEIGALCRLQPDPKLAPLVLLLHGLTGSAKADYMIGMAEKCYAAGFSAVRMNLRGCGGTDSHSCSLYNAAQFSDIEQVARALHEQLGAPRIYLAGCSLGGGMILRMLGEWGERAPSWLIGAAVVSPAVDLALSQQRLDTESGCRLYREFFLRGLKDVIAERAKRYPALFDAARGRDARTLREFDDRVTAHYAGFASAEHYYASSSALATAAHIRKPTLIVTAKDDPFIAFASFERPEIRRNTWISLVAPDHGGHMAFLGARPAEHRNWIDLDRHWAENRVVQFLDHLEGHARPAYARPA